MDVEFSGEGGSPLARHKAFVEAICPRCGKQARRETDTMDTFVESSWYFGRYCSAHHDIKPGLDRKKLDYWMPVDQYIGGIEHAILHLLYSRFYTKMLRDFGVLGVDEPFTNMLTQGMVCKETMRCPNHGYLFPEEVKEGKCVHCSEDVVIGKTEKMSKSLKNVVDPDYLINTYGADTVRVFCLFASPPEKDLEWSDQGVEGGFRFLNRIWRIIADYLDDIKDILPCDGEMHLEGDLKALRRKTHQTIRKVTADIEERFHFNTAISSVMELVNALYQLPRPTKDDPTGLAVVRETVEAVIVLLAPIVPHVTEELWALIGGKGPLVDVSWPDFDHAVASEEKITIVLQINGKVRSRITVAADEEEETIKTMALAEERIAALTEGKKVVKVIYVPKKLVNIVVAG
jgi:leucyl-tRNA synthetase